MKQLTLEQWISRKQFIINLTLAGQTAKNITKELEQCNKMIKKLSI